MQIHRPAATLRLLRQRVTAALKSLISVSMTVLVIPAPADLSPTPFLEGPLAPSTIHVRTAGPNPAWGDYNPDLRSLRLSNDRLQLAISYTSLNTAGLTLLQAGRDSPLIKNACASLSLRNGASIDLSTEARPTGRVTLQPVEEPALGPGVQARAEVWIGKLERSGQIEVTLFERGPYFTYRLVLPQDQSTVSGFTYLSGTFLSNEGTGQLSYLADADAVKEGTIPNYPIDIPVGQGKPLLLRNGPGSLLLAVVDPSDAPSTFRASSTPTGTAFQWQQRYAPGNYPDGQDVSPRLLVQLVDDHDLIGAFAPYRSLMQTLYPPAPAPDWFRHQWISWYLYGTEIDEQKLRSQIDYIAANLNDAGPWSILIDAGWYLAEGRSDGDWKNVDLAKFPSGLQPLVDYAHSRGIKVVLYFSASYLDDRVAAGNWLGLKGIIDQHPDWLLPIRSGDPWHAYYYNYADPEFQEYLKSVLHDYFVKYGVDGIKVDGMEDSRLAVERGIQRGLYTGATQPVLPTTSVYAFIYNEASALRPDVYVEAGWRMPAYSAPNFTVARQSDDNPDFDSSYPAPGLRDHVDYAIAQWLLLGQRPHLGNFWGDPNGDPIGLQWLEAGLALNAPVVLGFDLPSLTPPSLSDYRSRLTMLRPFAGQIRIPGGLRSDSFSTTLDGTTFLALLNRDDQAKEMSADLADHGLPGDVPLAGYDVEGSRPLSVRRAVMARVDPHTLRLFVLRSQPGVLWTNSSFQLSESPGRLTLDMAGPSELPGFAEIATPMPNTVRLNGEPLSQDRWSYDAQAGVLRVEYPYGSDGTAQMEVQY